MELVKKRTLLHKPSPTYLQDIVHSYNDLSSMGLLISVFSYLISYINSLTASQSGLQKLLPKSSVKSLLGRHRSQKFAFIYLPTLTSSIFMVFIISECGLSHKTNTVQAQNFLILVADFVCSFCFLFSAFFSQNFNLHMLSPSKLWHINTEEKFHR